MKAKEVLLSSVTATSLMTLFSHLIADTEKQNFSEPKLLAKIEKKKLPGSLKLYALPAAWITHYSVGILMTLFFNITWQQLKIKSTFQRGISAGIVVLSFSKPHALQNLPCAHLNARYDRGPATRSEIINRQSPGGLPSPA